MPTALTLYLRNVASAVLGTANQLETSPGTTEGDTNTIVANSLHWGELYSQGNAGAWPSLSSEPGPSGHGWILDANTLTGQTIPAGTWVVSLKLGSGGVRAMFAYIVARVWVRHSNGTYTQVGSDITYTSAATITPTPTIFTISASLPAISLASGDHLYFDLLLNITGNSGNGGVQVYQNAPNDSFGNNPEDLITPGYAPTGGVVCLPVIPAPDIQTVVTGRRRTLTWSISFSGLCRFMGWPFPPPPGYNELSFPPDDAICHFEWSAPLGIGTGASGSNLGGAIGFGGPDYSVDGADLTQPQFKVNYWTGFGSQGTSLIPGTGGQYNTPIEVTLSYAIDMEEVMTVIPTTGFESPFPAYFNPVYFQGAGLDPKWKAVPADSAAPEFDIYAAGVIADSCYGRKAYFGERPRAGGNATVTVILNGGTPSTISDVIPSGQTAIGIQYSAGIFAYCSSSISPGYSNLICIYSDGINSFSVGGDLSASSAPNGTVLGTMSTSGGIFTTATGAAPESIFTGNNSSQPPLSCRLQGQVRAMNGSFPGSVPLVYRSLDNTLSGPYIYTEPDGTIERTNIFRYVNESVGSAGRTIYYGGSDGGLGGGGTVVPVSSGGGPSIANFVDEIPPFGAFIYIDDGRKSGLSFESLDTRCMFQGKRWNALKLSQAASLGVGVSSPVWSGSSCTVLAVTGGEQLQPSTGGTATLSLTVEDWSGYRYLQFPLKSTNSGAQPMTVTINGKTWVVHSGAAGSFGTATIDLCAPTNKTDTSDEQATKYPLPTTDGPYWGVSSVDTIEFSGMTAGETYVVGALSLVRMDHSRVNVAAWDLYSEDDGQGDIVQTVILGETDYRQSLQEFGIIMAAAPGCTAGERTISALSSALNSACGWSCMDLNPTIDSYHGNGTCPSAFLCGNGGWWDGAEWHSGYDLDASPTGLNELVLPAVALWDKVVWYPGCGDVWNNNGTYSGDGTLPLYFNKVLRGDVYGLVLQNDHTPNDSALIQTVDNGTEQDSGSGTTDERGGFYTGGPFGRAAPQVLGQPSPTTHTVSTGQPVNSITDMWTGRRRLRLVLVAGETLPGIYPWNFAGSDGTFERVMIDPTGGNVQENHSHFAAPPFAYMAVSVNALSACTHPRIVSGPYRRLHVTYLHGGVCFETVSDDAGKTWTAPVQIFAAASFQTIAVRPEDGSLLWVAESGGNLSGIYQGPGDTSPSAPFTLADETGAALSVGSDSFHIIYAGGLWWLHALSGGSSQVWFSDNNGRNWQQESGWGLSGSRPTLCGTEGGDLVLATLVQNGSVYNIHCRSVYAGESAPSTVYTLTDDSGADLACNDDTFSLAIGYEMAARMVLSCVISGDIGPSEWHCGGFGPKMTRCLV